MKSVEGKDGKDIKSMIKRKDAKEKKSDER